MDLHYSRLKAAKRQPSSQPSSSTALPRIAPSLRRRTKSHAKLTLIGRRSSPDEAGPWLKVPAAGRGFPRTGEPPLRRDRRSPSSAFYAPSGRPIFSRSASVRSGRTSASISCARKVASYWPRPRPFSHSPRSMAAPHMASRDNRSVAASCPALRVAGSAGTGSSESHRRMTSVRATNAFGRGRLSSAHRSFIASNLKVALVDLTRSPNHWGMTGFCAQQTAGVDVNRA